MQPTKMLMAGRNLELQIHGACPLHLSHAYYEYPKGHWGVKKQVGRRGGGRLVLILWTWLTDGLTKNTLP